MIDLHPNLRDLQLRKILKLPIFVQISLMFKAKFRQKTFERAVTNMPNLCLCKEKVFKVQL